MVHSGYEPSAVTATFSSLKGLLTTARLTFFGPGQAETIPEDRDSHSGSGKTDTQAALQDLPEMDLELPVLS